MQNKLTWMAEQAKLDEMNFAEDEIRIILETQSGVGVFSDLEVDYILELDREWQDQ